MYFNVKDIEQFHSQKDFIDTVLVPLLPLDFSIEGSRQSSSAADYLMSLTAFLEKQFKGRIFLTPPFSYFHKNGIIDLEEINTYLMESGFKHVLFITCDQQWREKNSQFNVTWIPAIPLESMDQDVKQRLLQDQLNLVVPSLTKVWTSI